MKGPDDLPTESDSLRETEERFRLLIESVQDYAIFMLDPEGRVMSWNIGAQRCKGYSATEIIGQHFSVFYPEEALARGWPEHELSVARREGRFEDEGWRLRKDGSRFWANVVITAVHDATGKLRGFAKVTRDLTEQRKVEKLEEEGRRISEFLAMLGHELRNPLAPIRNAVAVLKVSGSPDPTGVWACGIIERQVLHLGRIVDDLLDLGRVTSGKISIHSEPLDLREVVVKAVDSMRALFEGKQQRLEERLLTVPLWIVGDSTRLSQVLLNLLSNAHKFTPAGGHIQIFLERDGRSAQLRIRDDGIGISETLLTRVFEPFFQGERSLDRAEGGLGIGLTLVRKLVELHGGSVSASSAGPGRGSELVVRLPVIEPVKEPPAAAPAPEAAARLRVLVVDDNEDSVETLAMLLRLWGHEVRTASDGPGALAAAAEYQPAVVLLDIGLPGMNGYAVAERLRTTPAVLIAMTGYGLPEDKVRTQSAGFFEHLVKPVDTERLQQILTALAARGE